MNQIEKLPTKTTGILFLLFVVFFGITYAILGSAINWPKSLDESPEKVFSLISQHKEAVIWGYYAFLFDSFLLIPMAMFLRKTLGTRKSTWLDVATIFAVLASVMKVLGIFRWLFLMPGLADASLAPGATENSSEMASMIYTAFSNYTDGFGTHLGDQLFTGLWIGISGFLMLRTSGTSRIMGISAILVLLAQIVACVADFMFKSNPLLSVAQSLVFVWALVMALIFLIKPPALTKL